MGTHQSQLGRAIQKGNHNKCLYGEEKKNITTFYLNKVSYINKTRFLTDIEPCTYSTQAVCVENSHI